MNYTILTRQPIEVNKLNDLVADNSCGAISIFVGTTRDNFNGEKVLSLEYECYEQMAIKQMEVICTEVRSRWSDTNHVAICHRLGLVPVREASVVIAVSSPHRQTALEAVGFTIDELKRRVPIWKKEQYENGQSDWKENKECPWLKIDSGRVGTLKNGESVVTFAKSVDLVPKNLVQISANENEVQRRILCFIDKKRDEINATNLKDYTQMRTSTGIYDARKPSDSDCACARTNSINMKQEHLKVKRVDNNTGPQIRPNYTHELEKYIGDSDKHSSLQEKCATIVNLLPLNDRLNIIEEYVRAPVEFIENHKIHERIKVIENRILHLESVSPEYKHFLTQLEELHENLFENVKKFCGNCKKMKKYKRKQYTTQELNGIISALEEKDTYIDNHQHQNYL